MDKAKKFYITRVNQNGELAIPSELFKNFHSGLMEIETKDSQIIRQPGPNHTFTWTPEKNK
jgi:hypothetical protein